MTTASRTSRAAEQETHAEAEEGDASSPAWAILYEDRPDQHGTGGEEAVSEPPNTAPRVGLGGRRPTARPRRSRRAGVAAGLTVVVVGAVAAAWFSRHSAVQDLQEMVPARNTAASQQTSAPASPRAASADAPAAGTGVAQATRDDHPSRAPETSRQPVHATAPDLAHRPPPSPRLADTSPQPAPEARHPAAATGPEGGPARTAGVAAAHENAKPPRVAAPSGNQAVAGHSTAPASVAAARPAGSAPPAESAPPRTGRLNQPPTSTLAAAEPKSPAIPTAAPRRAASAAPPVSKANLIVIATGHDTLAALYRKVYRGVTPPAFTAVAALNPQQPRPGDVLTFPPPAGGWHADSSPAATRK